MKSRIPFTLLIASLFFLTGCYTQLQYSQRIHRITDEPQKSDTYTYEGEQTEPRAESAPGTDEDEFYYEEGYEDGYYDGTEDAFYYKDYKAAEWYARHGFGSFYHDYYFHRYGFPQRSFYSRYHFHDPFFYDYYPGTFATFSLSLHFGHSFGAFYGYPHHWYRYRAFHYWDPYYGYGYRPVFVNNYFYSGYAGYVGVGKDKKDRTYGRRTVTGTNRVRSGASSDAAVRSARTASEVREKGRTNTTRLRTRDNGNTVRSRGTVRTRSSSDTPRVRSTGRSSTGRSSSGSTTRRSRDNESNRSAVVTGTENDNSRARPDYRDYSKMEEMNRERIRNRIKNSRTSQWGMDRNIRDLLDLDRPDRSGNRIRINFDNSNRSSGNSIYNRKSRSSSSNSSSGTRVRSQSSSSSSRGNVSSSRSRSSSGDNSSSGSSSRRSRGN